MRKKARVLALLPGAGCMIYNGFGEGLWRDFARHLEKPVIPDTNRGRETPHIEPCQGRTVLVWRVSIPQSPLYGFVGPMRCVGTIDSLSSLAVAWLNYPEPPQMEC